MIHRKIPQLRSLNQVHKILIIDDEASIRSILRLNLKAKGFDVDEATNAKSGLEKVSSYHPHLIILDLELPDHHGFQVLKNIRSWSTVPIVVLTVSDAETTKVELLEAGADDYITKPFSMPELFARVKVALRHHQTEEASPVFESGDLRVDLVKRQVSFQNQDVKLTVTEYEFLRILIKHAGRVVPQDHLLTEIWGKTAKGNNHYLRIYAAQIRKKIERDPSKPEHLLTEPGVGYRIA